MGKFLVSRFQGEVAFNSGEFRIVRGSPVWLHWLQEAIPTIELLPVEFTEDEEFLRVRAQLRLLRDGVKYGDERRPDSGKGLPEPGSSFPAPHEINGRKIPKGHPQGSTVDCWDLSPLFNAKLAEPDFRHLLRLPSERSEHSAHPGERARLSKLRPGKAVTKSHAVHGLRHSLLSFHPTGSVSCFAVTARRKPG
jgi:hypothetical protein